MGRTRTARTTLPGGSEVPHAVAEGAGLRTRTVQRALKGFQLDASAPKADEREARLCEKQSFNRVYW